MGQDIFDYVQKECRAAKEASVLVAQASKYQKVKALEEIARSLREHSDEIIAENARDIAAAEANGMKTSMVDRLRLDHARINAIANAAEKVAALPDPLGEGTRTERPNGLEITAIRVPLGVCAMIYEARPNVTVDAAVLCLKAGNAVVLRGGKEAICSNRCLIKIMRDSLERVGLPGSVIGFIDNTTRESSEALMKMRGLIDVLIPRGGAGLIRSVVENSKVPVIETGAGNCHLYVDADADLDMAVRVAVNAKTQRPSVCNAIETLLCHASVAEKFLPKFYEQTRPFNLEIRGCERTRAVLSQATAASAEDYATEYNDYIIAVKIVDSVDEAIAHIREYTTGHSECIITENIKTARKFQAQVDCAAVYVNASTRFTDGEEFGFGAEIGISTQKLHARGPMGLRELTTVKYLVCGDGQIRQ